MTPIKFTFLSSRALQKDSDCGVMALIVPSIILLCRRLLTSLYKVVASASAGWNWIIIIPHKTWEGEKTLRGGDICDLVTKSFGLLVWLFPLPGAFSVEAQGWVVAVVHWYATRQACANTKWCPKFLGIIVLPSFLWISYIIWTFLPRYVGTNIAICLPSIIIYSKTHYI